MADIANTALYIHEGDAVNAIMCGMAAIPGIGDLASLAKKSYNAFKTSKTGIKIMNAPQSRCRSFPRNSTGVRLCAFLPAKYGLLQEAASA